MKRCTLCDKEMKRAHYAAILPVNTFLPGIGRRRQAGDFYEDSENVKPICIQCGICWVHGEGAVSCDDDEDDFLDGKTS